MIKPEFSKYETARILGARALHIAMDAPLLLKVDKEKLEAVRYDPLRIAELEFKSGVLPISVKRPFPQKVDLELKREKEIAQEKAEEQEQKEEKAIKETGEIMELAKPEDEVEEVVEESDEGEEAI